MENFNTSEPQESEPSAEQLARGISFVTNTASFFVNEEKKRAFWFNHNLYIEQKKLGYGQFSNVFLFENTTKNSLHALKVLKDNSTAEVLEQQLQKMKEVDSQFVIKIEDFIKIDDQLCIMMEYANQGTLEHFITNVSNKSVIVSASQILDLICGIFSGLNELHTRKMVHRGLKIDNLLVSNYQIKIAEFGVSTYLISKEQSQKEIGNIQDTDLEKLNERETHNYNFESDIFSAGLIILQMLLGFSNNQIFKMKINLEYLSQIQDSPEILKNFISQLLDENPSSRPTAIEAFNLAGKMKYDEKLLDYINNKINGVQNELSNPKGISLIPNQSSPSLNNQENSQQSNEQNSSSKNDLTEEQLFQKGMQHFCEANYESAEQSFSQILEKNPVSVEGLTGRLLCGQHYQFWINKNKQYTDEWIEDQLKFIQSLNPNHYMYYFCQGMINIDIDSINKCIELNPTMAIAIAFKGTLLLGQNKIDEAIQCGLKALEISENNNFVLRLLGTIYLDHNKDTAEKYFQKSLVNNPNDYFPFHNLGLLYKDYNELDKALQYFNKSLIICPYYRCSIEEKINLMLDQTQYKEVIEEIQSLFSKYGEQEFLYTLLAYSYYELRDYSNALVYYTKNLIQDENCVDTMKNIASIYRHQKDYKNARIYYKKCNDTESKLAYIEMYELLVQDPDTKEEALEILRELFEFFEIELDDESECVAMIYALRELEDYEQFFVFADLALKQHPTSSKIGYQILKLIGDEDFIECLDEQYELAVMIESTQGVSEKTTKCQLKYFYLNGQDDMVVSHILKYIQNYIRNREKDINTHYNYPTIFNNYITQDNLQIIYDGVKEIRFGLFQ